MSYFGFLTPQFSANRAVREYAELHYLSAAAAYRERAAESGSGAEIRDWQRWIAAHWDGVGFGEARVKTGDRRQVFEVAIYLGNLRRTGWRWNCTPIPRSARR